MTASPGSITHVGVVPVFVTDQQRALEFYRDALGFTVHTDARWGEQRWIEVGPPAADTRLSLLQPSDVPFDAQAGEPTGIAFRTDDAAACYDTLVAGGANLTSRPHAEPWGTWFGFADPDGNEFIVSQAGVA